MNMINVLVCTIGRHNTPQPEDVDFAIKVELVNDFLAIKVAIIPSIHILILTTRKAHSKPPEVGAV